MNLFKAISEFLRDKDDSLSMTRLTILIYTITYVIQSSYIVYFNKVIPDIPMAIAGLLVGLYGFNKTNINIGKSDT